ncbi:MAG: family 20 glycosylhydrolase, partial [Verrucomicrobiota bacterium]
MKSDFKVKGLHLDLRIQVMPLLALKALAKRCAEQGLNTLLIEWEASFPYEKNFIISNSYAYSPQEIKSFIQFCKGLGIQVIPLQQCFGHIEYILRHERYAHLRESHKDICQLCPSKKKESLQVFTEIFKEIVASHPSPYIHIGGDETYLLGHCPTCKARAEKEGESRLYVDYFKEIAKCVLRLGKRPILWADMLLKHPEDAGEMPSETIFMDWNYGWKVDHFGSINALRKKYPFEMWGAPAIRCHPDNHGTTDWNTHFQNIHDYIPYARKARYEGIVMTSWSTSGIYGYECRGFQCNLCKP